MEHYDDSKDTCIVGMLQTQIIQRTLFGSTRPTGVRHTQATTLYFEVNLGMLWSFSDLSALSGFPWLPTSLQSSTIYMDP